MKITDLLGLLTGVAGILGFFAILCFTLYSCDANSDQKNCVKEGGSWVQTQFETDSDYEEFSCLQPGQEMPEIK